MSAPGTQSTTLTSAEDNFLSSFGEPWALEAASRAAAVPCIAAALSTDEPVEPVPMSNGAVFGQWEFHALEDDLEPAPKQELEPTVKEEIFFNALQSVQSVHSLQSLQSVQSLPDPRPVSMVKDVLARYLLKKPFSDSSSALSSPATPLDLANVPDVLSPLPMPLYTRPYRFDAAQSLAMLPIPTEAVTPPLDSRVRPVITKRRSGRAHAAAPSKFCHICARTQRSAKVVCSNIATGKCRKAVCELCFEEHGWDFAGAASRQDEWKCPHCVGVCHTVPRARCHLYSRTNAKRKALKR